MRKFLVMFCSLFALSVQANENCYPTHASQKLEVSVIMLKGPIPSAEVVDLDATKFGILPGCPGPAFLKTDDGRLDIVVHKKGQNKYLAEVSLTSTNPNLPRYAVSTQTIAGDTWSVFELDGMRPLQALLKLTTGR